jgi:hypothetical protein
MEHNDLPHFAHLVNHLETRDRSRAHYDNLLAGSMYDEFCAGQEEMD